MGWAAPTGPGTGRPCSPGSTSSTSRHFQHFTTTSTVVEHSDGRLAGFLVGFLSPAEPGTAYVHVVGVDPDVRRAGLGAALYRRFYAEAGARTIRAVTSPINTPSIAFHTALGFTVSAVRPDYDGPGHDRVCFTRTLPTDEPTPPV